MRTTDKSATATTEPRSIKRQAGASPGPSLYLERSNPLASACYTVGVKPHPAAGLDPSLPQLAARNLPSTGPRAGFSFSAREAQN